LTQLIEEVILDWLGRLKLGLHGHVNILGLQSVLVDCYLCYVSALPG